MKTEVLARATFPVASSLEVREHVLVVRRVQGAAETVPVREVQGEVLGGVAVVHVVVLNGVEPLEVVREPPQRYRYQVCDVRLEWADLITSVASCAVGLF